MKRINLSCKSAVEVKLPRRITLRMMTPNTISIWLSHDVCLGKYTKRTRWPLSAKNSCRVACDLSTPALPFFSQILFERTELTDPLHQTFRSVNVQVVNHEHPRGPWVRGHRLGHVLHEIGLR